MGGAGMPMGGHHHAHHGHHSHHGHHGHGGQGYPPRTTTRSLRSVTRTTTCSPTRTPTRAR
jgi:hypothetical protein